jgi:hypothetical protein
VLADATRLRGQTGPKPQEIGPKPVIWDQSCGVKFAAARLGGVRAGVGRYP